MLCCICLAWSSHAALVVRAGGLQEAARNARTEQQRRVRAEAEAGRLQADLQARSSSSEALARDLASERRLTGNYPFPKIDRSID